MKFVKILFKIILWLVGIVVVLVLTLPLWIGSVVKPIANSVVPTKTGTKFNLGRFELNQYSGRVLVGDIQLYNPPQFSQQLALSLGSIEADIDVGSVASDTVVIRDIVIRDVFVSYVSDGKGKNNFDSIIANVKGEAPANGKSDSTANGKTPTAAVPEQRQAEVKASTEKEPGKKVVIDRLSISGILVQYGKLTVPLPTITLTGIGRDSNGVTIDQAWSQIYGNFLKNAGVLGDSLKGLGINVGNVAGALQDAGVDKAVKTLDMLQKIDLKKGTNGAIDATGNVLKEATGVLKGFLK